jgi:hypothetical protein
MAAGRYGEKHLAADSGRYDLVAAKGLVRRAVSRFGPGRSAGEQHLVDDMNHTTLARDVVQYHPHAVHEVAPPFTTCPVYLPFRPSGHHVEVPGDRVVY